MEDLTHLSLFSGIGGIDLAAEWVGFRTVLFIEIDSYCQKVLRKRWPNVPIIGDIRGATKERIMDIAISSGYLHRQTEKQSTERGKQAFGESEPRSGNGVHREDRPIAAITLITGGFPCQPVSAAGKRRGKADDRWLWPEMLRVIREIRSTWVVAENVAGLLNMGFNDCVSDLESEGYKTIPFLIPACGVNAPHRRDRIFIVAHTTSERCSTRSDRVSARADKTEGQNIEEDKQVRERQGVGFSPPSDVADTEFRTERTTHGKGSDRGRSDSKQDDRHSLGDDIGNGSSKNGSNSKGNGTEGGGCQLNQTDGRIWWAVEPELGRVAYGIPNRVDRLKCLGNAVVPQQIYPILKAIADIENGVAQ